MRRLPFFLSLILLAGCGEKAATTVEGFGLRKVTLPDGTEIQAEVMTHRADMARGMMFRESLPEGRGMLFIHGEPGKYPYWMYQVRIPLDIIWMDANGVVVEMVENAPPCKTQAVDCPNFGGTRDALVILELPGGSAKRRGVAQGQRIRF